MEALTRSQCVLLFVLGQMDELREKGLVQGGWPMTDKGFEAYRHLVDTGFQPTPDELATASKTIYYEILEKGREVMSRLPN